MYTPDNPDPAWWAEDAAAAEEAERLYWQWYHAMDDRALEEQARGDDAMPQPAQAPIPDGLALEDLPF